jgi:hypothetical protein
MGWLGYGYLLLILFRRLLRSNTIEEGRAQIRRMHLTWGMLVALFILTNLI